jgi:hypothetical protein
MTAPSCAVCGGAIPRHPLESRSHWLRRITCSMACRARRASARSAEHRVARIAALGTRTCRQCGGPIVYAGANHRLSEFSERTTCSLACQRALQRDIAIRSVGVTRGVTRCADPDCGHPLSDPATRYCTDQDNPCCVRRRRRSRVA